MSAICCVLGCDRAAKPHYSRCESCIRVLLDSHLPKPEPYVALRRAEKFRLVER